MPYPGYLDLYPASSGIMANILKRAASGLLDKLFLSAEVITVQNRAPSSLYELLIYFPKGDMSRWTAIQRVKCKVDEFQYRDYTPAAWNTETKCFSLFIAAGHDGAGARWVKRLKAGDQILLSAVYAAPLPANTGKILALGDASALAHFLALRQLTDSSLYPMDAAITLSERFTLPASLKAVQPGFDFLMEKDGRSLESLTAWLSGKVPEAYTSIYIAGNIPMVSSLRRQLKLIPALKAKIYTHGFWS
jgi:NADPH-dependent ferric siderophore reductase